jgi:DNA-binding transcriptional ArsR family regulator
MRRFGGSEPAEAGVRLRARHGILRGDTACARSNVYRSPTPARRSPSQWNKPSLVDEQTPSVHHFDNNRNIGTDMKAPDAVTALAALAHEYRLSLYRMLVVAGPEGLNAGTIATRLKLPPSSLTFHLQQLHRAGLITQERDSRQLIYAADFGAMNALVGYLTENCCGGASSCAVACTPAATAKKSSKKSSKAA